MFKMFFLSFAHTVLAGCFTPFDWLKNLKCYDAICCSLLQVIENLSTKAVLQVTLRLRD